MSKSVSSQASASEKSISQASTTLYEQEPFSKFEPQVRALWSPLADITIERMHGGSYNRVIGIAVSASGPPSENRLATGAYVLRIPRGKSTRIEQEIATLHYVRGQTTIPAPEIVQFDLTSNNTINSKYSLQQKIPGERLFDVYMKISQSERSTIVRQLAYILREMHELSRSEPGLLEAANLETTKSEDGKLVPDIRIVDFRIRTFLGFAGETLWGGMEKDSAEPKSVSQLLIDQFEGWKKFGRNCNRGEEEDQLMEKFCEVTEQMSRLGLLPEGEKPYVLFHPDFAPQNILVYKTDEDSNQSNSSAIIPHTEAQNSQSGWKVTGVLDWDGTAFVPYSVACTPPWWLWSDWNDDEEDEAVLCSRPVNPEARERKELFDSIMGERYTDHAYSHDYRFVRRLFEFATDGFIYSHRYADAEVFFEEWEKRPPQLSSSEPL